MKLDYTMNGWMWPNEGIWAHFINTEPDAGGYFESVLKLVSTSQLNLTLMPDGNDYFDVSALSESSDREVFP